MQAGLAGAAMAGSGMTGTAAYAASPQQRRDGALRILVLGGTGFLGPHMVRESLRRGHDVSLFNRGRTADGLFPDLETYIGNRDSTVDNGLEALEGHRWDVVVDNSGYVPRHVRDSARLLSKASSHYIFVSSISVYATLAVANDEDSPLATMPDESVEEVTGETYGPMKALCEQMAAREFGEDRVTVLRPTYVCGPGDHTDRFTYWPVRTMRGGRMLWPGSPADAIQIIDVRDLANFCIDCAEQRTTGIYNTVTPPGSLTMGGLLSDCVAVTGADVTPVWVGAKVLREHNALRSIPIWSPAEGDSARAAMVSGNRALEQGLRNRPARETARDTVSWWQTLPAERRESLRAGLSPAREAELLAL